MKTLSKVDIDLISLIRRRESPRARRIRVAKEIAIGIAGGVLLAGLMATIIYGTFILGLMTQAYN